MLLLHNIPSSTDAKPSKDFYAIVYFFCTDHHVLLYDNDIKQKKINLLDIINNY